MKDKQDKPHGGGASEFEPDGLTDPLARHRALLADPRLSGCTDPAVLLLARKSAMTIAFSEEADRIEAWYERLESLVDGDLAGAGRALAALESDIELLRVRRDHHEMVCRGMGSTG